MEFPKEEFRFCPVCDSRVYDDSQSKGNFVFCCKKHKDEWEDS